MARRIIQSGNTNMGGGTGAGGGSSDQMQNIIKQWMLQDMRSGGKNISKLNTLLSVYAPSASEVKAKEKKALDTEEAQSNLGQIQRTIDLLGKVKTGPLQNIWMGFKTKANLASQEELELQNLVNQIKAEKMFSIGGKALTGPERAILSPFTPGMEKTSAQNIMNLQQMIPDLQRIFAGKTSDANYMIPGPTGGQPSLEDLFSIYGNQ